MSGFIFFIILAIIGLVLEFFVLKRCGEITKTEDTHIFNPKSFLHWVELVIYEYVMAILCLAPCLIFTLWHAMNESKTHELFAVLLFVFAFLSAIYHVLYLAKKTLSHNG